MMSVWLFKMAGPGIVSEQSPTIVFEATSENLTI